MNAGEICAKMSVTKTEIDRVTFVPNEQIV